MTEKRCMGKTPRFESPQALQGMIDAYFEACAGELLRDPATGEIVLDKQGQPVLTGQRPPTLSGLSLALGFSCREGLLGYRGKAQYRELLLRARSRLQQYAEEQLFTRGGSPGARYALEHALRPPEAQSVATDYEDILARVRMELPEDEF